MNRTAERGLALLVVMLGATGFSLSQVKTGTPPFGSFGGGPFDTINLGNLNVHFAVPIIHKAGRGLPLNYDLSFDSSVWYPVGVSGNQVWQPVGNWGWMSTWAGTTGYITQSSNTVQCYDGQGHPNGATTTISNWAYYDPRGVVHGFSGQLVLISGACPGSSVTSFTSTATDGSGMVLHANYNSSTYVTNSDGTTSNPGGSAVIDVNGNQITSNGSGVFTDTLGTTALTVSGTAPNPVSFTYTSPAGPASIVMHYTNQMVKTNFGCSPGIAEYGPTSNPLVSDITLPDGSQYTFTYEPTPGFAGDVTGRIKSVTLPTGGTITYTYSGVNNGITCADGSTAGLTRALNPGGTWTYSRTNPSGLQWKTVIADPTTPVANQTEIYFQKDSASSNFYETQRKTYQGSTSLLSTNITCYNGNSVSTPANCFSTNVSSPISRRTLFNYLPDSSGRVAETDITYNATYGLVTEVDDYDFGSGAVGGLIRKKIIGYASLGNGIVDRPSSVQVQDAGNAVKSSTTYSYDETGTTATSGTPQHVSTSGSRGNVTTLATQANGTATLYRKFTYYDTGTLNTSSDVSTSSGTPGATTTYNYSASSCGNSFVTSVNEPLALSRSMTWDCNGGVLLSVTDENQKITSTSYTDPFFWRPATTADQLTNITSFSYPSATAIETTMTFNSGASVADSRITVDGLGRLILTQREQGPSPSNYDSVETDYDIAGFVSKATLPYSAAAGTLCSGACPGTSQTYDSLGRVNTVTDSGGGSATYTYTKNDVYQTVPAPAGENPKDKQSEYDALGRLTSVCEITSSANGGGACAQSNPKTGYWTKYTYDILGNLMSVTQNAQASAQTRSYFYDMLGRMTSETNPETGTTQYFYDTAPSTPGVACSGTYAGDLVKRYDANGNTTCYAYDSLHRVMSTTYSGPNATTTNRYFIYDGATVNGQVMANTKGRMAEAYTATCSTCTKVTDLGFSYSARGELADTYESTPHSSGYYHVVTTYWANGGLQTISGVGLPTLTYGANGQGRTSTVSASAGGNPVTATSYNFAGQVTGVTFGSGDPASFSYDGNTGRMNQYKLTINGTATYGNLTWNANGTLKTLAITDPFNAADVQTCNYTHDDLARIASVNCGASIWQQNFAYDVFGNLNKTVPTGGTGISWLPTYNATTNRYSAIPGSAPAYDSNGNLTNDSFHTYAWDADNRSKTVDSVTLIYDALGREVEEQDAGVNTEFVYALGKKIALMNGQTQSKAFIPLPGGTQVKYIGATISTYRVLDWLGSPRVGSNTNRTYGWGVAYAPFGERYASSGSPMFSFTGANGDTKPDLYDFLFRELHSSQGRWISPDPAGFSAVDPSNPQSWNRYAYVLNNPLALIDPLGLEGCDYDACVNETIPGVSFINANTGAGYIFYSSLPTDSNQTGGGSESGNGSGSAGPNASAGGDPAKKKNCGASQSKGMTSIVTGNVTTNAPTVPVGAAIGALVGGPPGAFVGGIIGSFFGAGGTVSYVPSTKSVYAGATLVVGLGIGGGNGFSASTAMVPSGQNPNSIANGLSFSLSYQPSAALGSTVTKSPGSPPVTGPSVGTRIPVSGGVSYNVCLTNCGCP